MCGKAREENVDLTWRAGQPFNFIKLILNKSNPFFVVSLQFIYRMAKISGDVLELPGGFSAVEGVKSRFLFSSSSLSEGL